MDFSIEITIEVDCSVDVEIEVEFDFGMDCEITVEIEVEDDGAEDGCDDLEVEIDIGGWEDWGQDVYCPCRGWYGQFGNKNEMYFENFQTFEGGAIRGCGSDGVGEFDIYGRLDDSGYFSFNKQYRGAHTVIYRGAIDSNTSVWRGRWEIPGNCDGIFNIQPGFQRWSGFFKQFGNRNDMDFNRMYIGDSGVFGDGADNVGYFNIRGYKSGNQVTFAKTYVGAHTVYYRGTAMGRQVMGRWEIPGNCNGSFRLFGERNF